MGDGKSRKSQSFENSLYLVVDFSNARAENTLLFKTKIIFLEQLLKKIFEDKIIKTVFLFLRFTCKILEGYLAKECRLLLNF